VTVKAAPFYESNAGDKLKTHLFAFAAVGTMVLSGSSCLHAQSSPPTEMQFAQFLVGTWSCSHTVGDFSGTYTTTITNTLGNRWLRQTYDFPASASRPAIQGEFFFGYDPRNKHWLRTGAMSDGLYFTMVGVLRDNAWYYGYVLPGAAGTAVYTKKSNSAYTVDGPSYPENGRTVTEHHSCRKT
jgi:hypothetical protein